MNGLVGSGSSFVFSLSSRFFEGRAPLCLDDAGVELSRRIMAAGSTNRIFKIHGVDEYTVVATRVMPQLSRMSIRKAPALYGVNWRMRDCKTDHSRIVNCRWCQYRLAHPRSGHVRYRHCERDTIDVGEGAPHMTGDMLRFELLVILRHCSYMLFIGTGQT